MKAKNKKVTKGTQKTQVGSAAGQRPRKGGTPNGTRTKYGFPKVGVRETFNADSVTIESPGCSTTHTRAEVEGWLVGMNAARRLSDDDACREAVAETVKGVEDRRLKMEDSRASGEDGRLKMGDGRVTAACSDEACRDTVAVTVKKNVERAENARGVRLARAAAVLIAFTLGVAGATPYLDATEIVRGYAPQDGQQLYAADLDNLVDESVIGVQFYNDQQTTPVLGAGYYFLILNPANQTYYRINAQQMLYGNTNIFLNAPPEGVPEYGVLLFYDPTNNWIASTTVSNFLWNSASNINVAGLSFANSNNASAAMEFVLPRWPYPLSGLPPSGTNFPAHFIIFDTNGVPYREGLSNLEANVAFDMGTAFALPWEYAQEFAPWKVYGTNSVSPYTNVFGFATNFPITAYLMANNGNTLTNATLTDNDTVPVSSYQQGVAGSGAPTNTTMTLYSLYEYMTNKNALPPYTIARAQFSGYPAVVSCQGVTTLTNMSPASGVITNCPLAVNFTNPTPISFEGGQGGNVDTVPAVTSNVVYWAQVTNAVANPGNNPQMVAFQIFTNLATAQARVSPITGNGVNGAGGVIVPWYVTNYTAVNSYVIQDSNVSSLRTGVYDVYFDTPSQTAFYYLTGNVLQNPNSGSWANWNGGVNMAQDDLITTNFVRIVTSTFDGNNEGEFPLVQVLVQPQ